MKTFTFIKALSVIGQSVNNIVVNFIKDNKETNRLHGNNSIRFANLYNPEWSSDVTIQSTHN